MSVRLHKAVAKTTKTLMRYQVLKGLENQPKTMKPFGNPCMVISEAYAIITQSREVEPAGTETMWCIHLLSQNIIVPGSIVFHRMSCKAVVHNPSSMVEPDYVYPL